MSRYTENNCLAKWWAMYDGAIEIEHTAREREQSVSSLLYEYDTALLRLKEQLANFVPIEDIEIDTITGVTIDG